MAFASSFLIETESGTQLDLDLLLAVLALEHVRYYTYGKLVELHTDHQSIKSFLRKNETLEMDKYNSY